MLRVLRERVAPVQGESNTPPWFKVYPALAVTDYTGWDEVDAWAQRLFAPEKLHPSVAAQTAAIKSEGGRQRRHRGRPGGRRPALCARRGALLLGVFG